jgi:hypothetical protein
VDERLARKVTVGVKATALSDLCDQLRQETGIQLTAGRSVADEKVTLFCKELPLRDVMRQLSRPFGYAWLRSGKAGEYRYELAQDLRSQLLEEELRNRDRNAALLALDQEMQTYRQYLSLSPDEALARSKTAPPAEKKRLETMAGGGWGIVQVYFRLSPGDLAALRAGQTLTYSPEPRQGQRQLPPELGRSVLQTLREWRIRADGERWIEDNSFGDGKVAPEGLPLAQVPEVRGQVTVELNQTELGQFSFRGGSGFFTVGDRDGPNILHARDGYLGRSPLATAVAPAVRDPQNAVANARLARHPALRPRVTVQPRPSCRSARSSSPSEASLAEAKVTSADVLEALHQATGLPVVADYYTRLYAPAPLSVRNQTLFDTLNRLADGMHLRWGLTDGNWLQFRSASYFHDRLKEVPNRLLSRLAASRQQHGALTLEELIEIAQLSDAQLDASGMAEGARACWGLAEWSLPRVKHLRAQLRYLSEFTPEQRRQAGTPEGLLFTRMTLAQQQGYLARAFPPPEAVAGATLHVDYTLPGWFRWSPPGRACRPSPVHERTPQAALQAARLIDPQVDEAQIQPTRLDVTFLFTPDPKSGSVRIVRTTDDGWVSSDELRYR